MSIIRAVFFFWDWAVLAMDRRTLFCLTVLLPIAAPAVHAQSAEERDIFIFQQFDADRSSRIDADEFLTLGRLSFVSVDKDKNQFISEIEFWAIATGENEAARAAAFGRVDKNGDGRISLPEFEESQSEMFAGADSNGDGFLTFTEYKGL